MLTPDRRSVTSGRAVTSVAVWIIQILCLNVSSLCVFIDWLIYFTFSCQICILQLDGPKACEKTDIWRQTMQQVDNESQIDKRKTVEWQRFQGMRKGPKNTYRSTAENGRRKMPDIHRNINADNHVAKERYRHYGDRHSDKEDRHGALLNHRERSLQPTCPSHGS